MTNLAYWRKWTIACGIGEFLGIGVAAVIAIGQNFWLGESVSPGSKAVMVLLAILAGIIEGSITGYFQWSVLRKRIMSLRARNWLGFTALGAAIGWLIGQGTAVYFMSQPSTTSTTAEVSNLLVALLMIPAGAVLGTLFGAAQWIELRKHAPNAGRWIWANVLGWAVGFAVIYLGASLPTAETSVGVIILLGIIAGLIAGLLVGAITGLFLIKLGLERSQV